MTQPGENALRRADYLAMRFVASANGLYSRQRLADIAECAVGSFILSEAIDILCERGVLVSLEGGVYRYNKAWHEETESRFADEFLALKRSVDAFHERFGLGRGRHGIVKALRVTSEEAFEVVMAAARLYYDPNDPAHFAATGREDLAGEIADLFYTVLGVARQAGLDEHDLAAAMRAVTRKNDAKQPENTTRDAHGKVVSS